MVHTKTSGLLKTTTDYNNSQNRNIPITILYFFLISQFLTGLDFGFVQSLNNNNVRVFFRLLTIFVACIYNVIIFAPMVIHSTMLSYTIPLVLMPFFEYALNVIIMFRNRKHSIYVFINNISEFCNFTKNDQYMLYLISVIHCIIIFSLKIIFVLMNNYDYEIEPYFNKLPFYYYFFINLYYMLVDLIPIAQIVIFYYVYNSVKHLKRMLMSSGPKLSFVMLKYKAIVDTRDKIRPLCDSLVSEII